MKKFFILMLSAVLLNNINTKDSKKQNQKNKQNNQTEEDFEKKIAEIFQDSLLKEDEFYKFYNSLSSLEKEIFEKGRNALYMLYEEINELLYSSKDIDANQYKKDIEKLVELLEKNNLTIKIMPQILFFSITKLQAGQEKILSNLAKKK